MKKSILFIFQAIAIIIATTLYCSSVVIMMLLMRSKTIFFPMCRSWSRVLLAISGVKVNIIGNVDLPPKTSCVYVCNHASLFDIPVLIAYLPDYVRIMYKRELRKIPIMGWTLAVSPFIAITRADGRDAMRSVNESIEAVQHGESVIVFAEGTRSQDGSLGEFKRGAFMVAARSRKAIVPVTLIGTSTILPKKKLYFNGGTVTMVINSSVTLGDEPNKQQENEARLAVHAIIADNLEKVNN
jgi:1-acyl-sn-glycerol-3-phosphate acyltransferase